MPFLDVNADKLSYLISYGTREGELQRFFKDHYLQLIVKGAKLRHRPSNRKDRINCLVFKLPRSTDEIVREYFQKHLAVEFPEPVSEILEWFSVFNDNGGGGLPADDAKRLARSALTHLFSPNPDPDLLAYLRAAPTARQGARSLKPDTTDRRTQQEEDAGALDSIPDAASLVARLPTLLLAATFGQTEALQDAASDLPRDTQTFVDGLLSARAGDSEALESAIESLDEGAYERSVLEGLRGRARAETRSASADPSGLRVVTPAWFSGEHPSLLKVIGVATKELDAVVFVKPLAVEVNGTWMRLTDTDRVDLFPISGDTMTHRGSGRRIPQVGEYVHWEVEHRDRDQGRTRYHLAEELTRIYEIVELEASSDDPDEARVEIQRRGERRRSPQPALFALSDGIVIAPRTADLSRDDAFDQPWSAWAGAVGLALDGRLLALDLPRGTSAPVDLAPLDLVTRRLVKSLVDEGKLHLSRKQLSELAELLRSQEKGLTHARAKRVLRQIEAITLDRHAVEELLPQALSRPEVQARVDEFVDSEVRRRLETRDGLLAEVDAARALKKQLQNDAKEIQKRLQLLEADTDSRVASAFENAIEKGLETLAGAAIFRKLSGGNAQPSASVSGVSAVVQRKLATGLKPQSLDEAAAQRALRDLGISQLGRLHAMVALQAARATGLALVISGSKARYLANILSSTGEGSALVVHVPLGFTGVLEFSTLMQEHRTVSAICLLNADASPIELYAGPLLDLVASRTADDLKNGQMPLVLVAMSGGDVSAGLSGELAAFALHLNVAEAQATDSAVELEDLVFPWPARAHRRLEGFASQLAPDEHQALLSLVRASADASQTRAS